MDGRTDQQGRRAGEAEAREVESATSQLANPDTSSTQLPRFRESSQTERALSEENRAHSSKPGSVEGAFPWQCDASLEEMNTQRALRGSRCQPAQKNTQRPLRGWMAPAIQSKPGTPVPSSMP